MGEGVRCQVLGVRGGRAGVDAYRGFAEGGAFSLIFFYRTAGGAPTGRHDQIRLSNDA